MLELVCHLVCLVPLSTYICRIGAPSSHSFVAFVVISTVIGLLLVCRQMQFCSIFGY